MLEDLVQVTLPASSRLLATFIATSSTLDDLVAKLLAEEAPALRLVAGAVQDDNSSLDPSKWAVQLVLQSAPNCERTDDELNALEHGILSGATTVEQALAPSTSVASTTAHSSSPQQEQFSAFARTRHLHGPALRLVYLPNMLELEFYNIPAFPEGFLWRFWISAETTAAQAVETIVEELGVRKVVVHGTKTAKVEYVLQTVSDGQAASTIPTSTPLVSYLLATQGQPPWKVNFTISPAWVARAGTVALGIAGAVSSSSKLNDKARIASRSEGKEGGWRPTSLFGGLWSGATVEEGTGEDEEEEEEEEGEGTIKGLAAAETAGDEGGPRTTQTSQSSTKARLSSLFTDWIAPDASTGATETTSPAPRSRLVSEPVPAARRFSSWTPGSRMSFVEGDGVEEEAAVEDEGELNEALEKLMDDLGLKGDRRADMRRLPIDHKRHLIVQHRQTTNPVAPLRPSRTGPELSNDGGGALAGIKRFSLASVGWGADPVEQGAAPPSRGRPRNEEGVSTPSSPSSAASTSSAVQPSTPSVGPPQTSSSWASWWSAPSDATGVGQPTSELARDTPQFYVDQIRSTKISQRSLVKHLIALRVRLATAKLSWTEEFLDTADGLSALQTLLEKITLKHINRREAQTDEDHTVQLEAIKCLRVLMNTDIGFEQVLQRRDLLTYVSYSLFTTSNKLRAQVADVLAALCLLSLDSGHATVLAALSDFRVAHDEKFRFQYLVESIGVKHVEDGSEADEDEDPSLWAYRTAAMSLINALVNSPDDLEARITLRDEFSRRGLNEVIASLRYVNPPDHLLTQLSVYVEERQEDQKELHDRATSHPAIDMSNAQLSELVRLAQEHADLFPLLVDTVKAYTVIFDRSDLDEHLRNDLVTILDNFVEHAGKLEDFDDGWRIFMSEYLKSVQHIVGQQALIRSSRVADVASVPTSLVEELESLRNRVEELSGERMSLRAELNEQIAETNVLRALPVERMDDKSSRTSSIRRGDKENFSGVIQRLVAKEKEVLELQARLESLPTDADAKKERAERSGRWEHLIAEIGQHKLKITQLESEGSEKDKQIQYLKRSLESVYGRFQSSIATAASEASHASTGSEQSVDAELMATRSIEALAQRDEEIKTLKEALEAAKTEAAAQRRLPMVFARKAPLPPPPGPIAGSTGTSIPPPSIPSSEPVLPPPPPPPPPPPAPPVPRAVPLSAASSTRRSDSTATLANPVNEPPTPRAPPPPPPPPPAPTFIAKRSESAPTPPSVLPPPPPPPPPPRIVLPLNNNSIRPSSQSVDAPTAPPPPAPRFAPAPPPFKTIVKTTTVPPKKMKPFFWTKATVSAGEGASVWSDLDTLPPLALADLDVHFGASATPVAPVSKASKSTTGGKKGSMTLLSHTRCQNVGILLARLRLPHATIRDAVVQLDDARLSIDTLKAIKHYTPTTDEMEAIRAFSGEMQTLSPSDQYFNVIMVIPRLSERLGAMLYRRRLEMEMEEIKPELTILRSAADELRSSSRLKRLLATVLAIGNTLNASTFRGSAQGFQLESLNKLKETRSTTSSKETPTLLHYLVRVVRKSDPSLLLFLDEATHVEAASRISFTTVKDSVGSLVTGLAAVKEEVRVLKRIQLSPQGDRFLPVMEDFLVQATGAIEALEMMGSKLELDLHELLRYYGEDPKISKPEDLFRLMSDFSSSLLHAEQEIISQEKHAARIATTSKDTPEVSTPAKSTRRPPLRTNLSASNFTGSPLLQEGRSSIGRGGFEDAMRDLRSGMTTRRQRSTAGGTRPLSRVFFDGSR